MFSVPTIEPTTLAAGETWHWTREFPDYPPVQGWALQYVFQGPDKVTINATVPAGTAGFDVLAAPAVTQAIPAGRYEWVAIVTLSGETHIAARGVLVVTPNFTSAPAGTLRTDNEKMLAAIRLRLYERATDSQLIEQYAIHGRSVAKMPMNDLVRLEGVYAARVRRERNPGKIGTPVEVIFGQPQ